MAARSRRRPRRHAYGWVPDLPDQRDYLYRVRHPEVPALPSSMDLRPHCSPIEDQGALGSCTAQALVGAMEFLENKDGVPFKDLSRLFVYYNERVLIGTTGWDSGATLRDGIKTLAKQGVCSEKLWPHIISRYKRKPKKSCYTEGLDHQITLYERLLSVEEMLGCLADGYPFVFGFSVYESFEFGDVATTGVAVMPEPDERLLGGHAVLAVGYDASAQRFLVRNSWGSRWGQRGYFTMPYAYLENRNLSDDFWTIRRGENM
ncbi:MAG: C1 family peptidase [Bacteroidetes bacterium]|nr:C1 family peptidase [Bacteroidota bacterium]